jgi:hypothetical protein
MKKKVDTYRPDSFRIIFLRERTTPYTSFASSSKGSAVDDGCCRGVVESGGGGVERAAFSFIATTIPVDDERVFRGLFSAETFNAILSGAAAGETA